MITCEVFFGELVERCDDIIQVTNLYCKKPQDIAVSFTALLSTFLFQLSSNSLPHLLLSLHSLPTLF